MPGTDLQGLIVPVVLPLDSSGAPDFSRLGSLCTELLDAGARGIWVNGSTGEVHDLTLAERAAVVSAVSAAVGGRGVVVAHVGDTSTKLAVAQAVAAAEVVSLVRALSLPSRGEWIGSIAALKWVMCELGALPSAAVAAPTEPLTLEERRHLATTAVPLAARLRTAA